MIQNPLFCECLAAIPEERKAEFDLSIAIATRIDEVLKRKGMTQRELAKRMCKRESEVSKWLTVRHNFTTDPLARISFTLGAPIINVATSSYSEVIEPAPNLVAEDDAEYGKALS